MKMPLFLIDDGDVSTFASIDELERYVESPDIEGYRVFDADGQVLQLDSSVPKPAKDQVFVPVGAVRLSCPQTKIYEAEQLARFLSSYLKLLGHAVTDLSLDQLVRETEARSTRRA